MHGRERACASSLQLPRPPGQLSVVSSHGVAHSGQSVGVTGSFVMWSYAAVEKGPLNGESCFALSFHASHSAIAKLMRPMSPEPGLSLPDRRRGIPGSAGFAEPQR